MYKQCLTVIAGLLAAAAFALSPGTAESRSMNDKKSAENTVNKNTGDTSTSSAYGRDTAAQDNEARIRVIVPQDAKVWFDGKETKQGGQVRMFESPELKPGKEYSYDVKAQWKDQNGKDVTQTRHIDVSANSQKTVDFTRSMNEKKSAENTGNKNTGDTSTSYAYGRDTAAQDNEARIRVIVPENAKLWFDGKETKQGGQVRMFESPELKPGKEYSYDVKAQWKDQNGKDVTQTRSIDVSANSQQTVDFTRSKDKDKDKGSTEKSGNKNNENDNK
jgi:uncharacterized protein (TIGR03000 family)